MILHDSAESHVISWDVILLSWAGGILEIPTIWLAAGAGSFFLRYLTSVAESKMSKSFYAD